jgi:anti-anti-sigma factor
MQAQLLTTFHPPRGRLLLAGEFDLSTRDRLARRLQDAIDLGCQSLEIDAAGVTYVDAGSLGILEDMRTRLEHSGGSLVVVGSSSAFDRVARLSGFSGLERRGPAGTRVSIADNAWGTAS